MSRATLRAKASMPTCAPAAAPAPQLPTALAPAVCGLVGPAGVAAVTAPAPMPAATLLRAALVAAALVAGVLRAGGPPEFAPGSRAGAVPPLPAFVTSREPCSLMAFVVLARLRPASPAIAAPVVAASAASPAAAAPTVASSTGSDARIHPRRLVFGPKPLPF